MRLLNNLILFLILPVVADGFVAPSYWQRSSRNIAHPLQRLVKQSIQEEDAVSESSSIDGLLAEDAFIRLEQVDKTIQSLRQQLPSLLLQPLTDKAAESLYEPNFSLVGPHGDEELVSDRDELKTLSAALVAATAAARQANVLAASFSRPTDAVVELDNTVLCNITLDASTHDKLGIEWSTKLLPTPGIDQDRILQGSSLLDLDNMTGRIKRHQLLNVAIGDQRINARVGETLARIRKAVRSVVQESPWPIGSILDELRGEFIQQAANSATELDETRLPSIWVTDSIEQAFNESLNCTNMSLIDDYESASPLPGSQQWSEYATSHVAITYFVERGLPILSEGGSTEDIKSLFGAEARLVGIDNSTLSEGASQVAGFYRTLASLRHVGGQSLLGNWRVQHVEADWKTRGVTVEWITSSPFSVEGKDVFFLADDGEVTRVEQRKLIVGESLVTDPEWFKRFVGAVQTGKGSVVGADLVLDLLQQVNGATPPSPKETKAKGPPLLDDAAAASVYNIVCALHRDLAVLSDLTLPPASDFIAADIELKGYLNEVLARGSQQYRQAFGVMVASFRGALRTRQVTIDGDELTAPMIEFQPDGSLKVRQLISLRVKTPGQSSAGDGLPFKLELVSIYLMNSSGKIQEHRLVETRINGQLTPGDVVTRWIKGEQAPVALASPDGAIKSFMEALSWARSLSSS